MGKQLVEPAEREGVAGNAVAEGRGLVGGNVTVSLGACHGIAFEAYAERHEAVEVGLESIEDPTQDRRAFGGVDQPEEEQSRQCRILRARRL